MTAVVALVGRPNVGKSTLFNRLTRSRAALVADHPGLTRDRQYGLARIDGRALAIVDTGGLSGFAATLDEAMAQQASLAVAAADVTLLLVDGRSGLTAGDELAAERLRRQGGRTLLVVNKTDGVDERMVLVEFAGLGFDEPVAISATHGRGMRQLENALLDVLPPEADAEPERDEQGGAVIGVVGRPNVGKSTLVNRLLGEARVVVYDEAGTTRDSIFIPYARDGRSYTLVDTAGVRRRGRVSAPVEKFSVAKTLAAIDASHVVVLLLDAREGLVEQDLHLLGTVLEHGRAVVLAANKWDGLDPDQRARLRAQLDHRLDFAPWIRVHFISAFHGSGVGELYASIDEASAAAQAELTTSAVTRALEAAQARHPPPMVRGRRIKLRYAHPGGKRPPTIVVHGNQVEALPTAYRRYLENYFRETFDLAGTPLVIELKGSDNPFAGRKNKLTPRQQRKRRRLKQHTSKAKKQRRG